MTKFGSCLCEQVRFAISHEFKLIEYCHCKTCRKSVGAPVMAWVGAATESFELLSGECRSYESSPGVQRSFCATCGTSLTIASQAHPEEIYVSLIALDDCHSILPEVHIWRSERVSWFETTDDLPRYLGFKHQGQLEV